MSRSLWGDYRDSLRQPEFWIYSTWLELVTKYRRSRLGLFWAVLPSLLYTFVVGGFFAYLQGYDVREFTGHLGVGYVLFRFVTVSLSESATACSRHSSFILDGRVRLTDYVLRVVAKAAFYFVVALPAVAVALAMSPDFEAIGLLTMIPALLLVVLNVAWMVAIVSIIGARLVDVHEFIGSVLMFSFLFTPIIWRAEQVPMGTLRGFVARANPLYHFIEIVRAPLLGEPLEWLSLVYVGALLLLGSVSAYIIYKRYARYVPVWI